MKIIASAKLTKVRTLSSFALLTLGALAFTTSVSAEVLTIPSDGTHLQSQPLQNGVQYLIQASGTYLFNGAGNYNCICDAACDTWNGGATWNLGNDSLFINSQPVNWLGTTDGINFFTNTFSPSHMYQYYILGSNQPLDFFISDILYSDNSGSLQVAITTAPVQQPSPLVNLIKAVKPSFSNLTINTNYQLQVSGDLNTWTNQGSAFTATNTSMVYPQYWDVDNWNSMFFRLQVTP